MAETITQRGSKKRRSPLRMLREPTTWAGLLSIAAAVATGGVENVFSPTLWSQLGAGCALIFAKEGE